MTIYFESRSILVLIAGCLSFSTSDEAAQAGFSSGCRRWRIISSRFEREGTVPTDTSGKEYDAWGIRVPNYGSILPQTIRRTRTQCIQDFSKQYVCYSWAEHQRRGWACVKIRIEQIDADN